MSGHDKPPGDSPALGTEDPPAAQASLIVLVAPVRPGLGVNLYLTLPPAGHPGHGSFFSNGPLLVLEVSET